jgi:hypothetical protein
MRTLAIALVVLGLLTGCARTQDAAKTAAQDVPTDRERARAGEGLRIGLGGFVGLPPR